MELDRRYNELLEKYREQCEGIRGSVIITPKKNVKKRQFLTDEETQLPQSVYQLRSSECRELLNELTDIIFTHSRVKSGLELPD
jgi:hypothetical protein